MNSSCTRPRLITGKNSLWERSTRVPLIFVAPGVTKPGTVCSQPASLLDIRGQPFQSLHAAGSQNQAHTRSCQAALSAWRRSADPPLKRVDRRTQMQASWNRPNYWPLLGLVLFGFAWWAPLVLAGAWISTHWLLRESAVWRDRNTEEVRSAQRDADYAYRLAVDAPASKELRLFGLVDWTLERFTARRTRLHELQYEATRMRQRPVTLSLAVVVAANLVLLWFVARDVIAGDVDLGNRLGLHPAPGLHRARFGGIDRGWGLLLRRGGTGGDQSGCREGRED